MAGSGDNPTTETPKHSPISEDPRAPSVRLLSAAEFTGEGKLDKDENNWHAWRKKAYTSLIMSGLWRYMAKPLFIPDPITEPRAHANWTDNDERACGWLFGAISEAEHSALGVVPTSEAWKFWDILEKRHKQDGPVAQVYLIREAMSLHTPPGESPLKNIDAISTTWDRALEMGELSGDLLKNITILLHLSNHPDMQFGLQDRMRTATTPLTFRDVRAFIEDKQRILDANKRGEASLALSAQSSKHQPRERPALFCTACKGTTHTAQYCVSPGGGMAGKTIDESRAQRAADRAKGKLKKFSSVTPAAKPSTPSPNLPATTQGSRVAVTHTAQNGQAYLAYVDPAHLHTVPQEAPTVPSAFANLASINTDTELLTDEDFELHGFMAMIEEAPEPEILPVPTTCNAELPVWILIEGDLKVTIDWTLYTNTNIDLAAVTTTALNQCTRTAISNTYPFYMDTGASTHLSPDRSDFLSLRPIASRAVKGVGGSSIFAVGIGDIRLRVTRGAWLILKDALYIPNAAVRLISIGALARDSQVICKFDDEMCWVEKKSTGAIIADGRLNPKSGLYSLNLQSSSVDHALTVSHSPDIETIHRRFGHANYQTIQSMARKGTIKGVSPSLANQKAPKCDACILGKQSKTIVPKQRTEGEGHRATRRLEKVWVDLIGPEAVVSRTGNLYVMDIVDDATSRGWSIALPNKSDAYPSLKAWELEQERATGLKVGCYNADQGELKSNEMKAWLESRGTQIRFTAPHTSAHIGRVERRHRTLRGKANAMRIHANLPPNMWDEMYLTASYLDERTPTASLPNGITPYEAWYGKPPDCSRLREIGCKAFVLILNRHNPKIFERSIECILVGYDRNAKTYRCYDRKTRKVYSSYHVSFVESHQLSQRPHTKPEPLFSNPNPSSLPEITRDATFTPLEYDDDDIEETLPVNPRDPIPLPADPDPLEIDIGVAPDQQPIPRRSSRVPVPAGSSTRLETALKQSAQSKARREEERTERRRKKLADIHEEEQRNTPGLGDERAKAALQDIQTDSAVSDQDLTDADSVKDLRTMFENLSVSESIEDAQRVNYILAAIADHSTIDPRTFHSDEPRDWEDSQKRPPDEANEWKEAFADEAKSLRDMGVYKLVPRNEVPEGHKVKKSKAVLKNKLNEDGHLARRKVRFVLKGFEQIYGKDYTSTTSPTARMESWRILLHIAAVMDWDAQQIDIKTAFLYGLLPNDEVQYMEQPQGFEERGKESWVWKLQRGLYGMKQAGRIWNQTMNDAMLSWGFTRLACESCIYYRKLATGIVISAVHVDDFISISSSPEENERFKNQMKTIWTISDLGEVRFCVGIAIKRDKSKHTVSLSQTALIDKIIDQFGQRDAHPTKTPMDPGLKLRRPDRSKFTPADLDALAKLPYRSLVGCCLYLAQATRYDIYYVVQQLSQYLDCYSYSHWNAAVHLVRYLKGTRNLQLVLGGTNPIQLTGFTDSDWANCLDTRRSVGGYAFTLGSGIISWTAKKQKTVASSSCEAEYTAAFECCKEAIWLRTLLACINLPEAKSTVILCDNNAAINLSEDPSLHQRVKHIDIKYHFLRERVHANEVRLAYVNTKNNPADLFTKALDTVQFTRLRGFMGLA